jgi:drug/metabolite transporter (DMT)-like permease
MALAWDAVVLLAALAAVRLRLNPREWLFPLCIVAATVLALIAVPGAPGNADRHRATQTIPLLLVLASGSMWSGTWVKQLSTLWRSAVRRAVRQVPLSVRG